uniref:Uncharacterized protein n=1 Tax=Arundo donax TaxID=35708 RepID=A0A0A8ZLG2_ARUDO
MQPGDLQCTMPKLKSTMELGKNYL